MQENYFQGTKDSPYHISIGGVLLNDKGEVACHYFDRFSHFGVEATDFYLLMRETIEPNESIETCLARGFMEEFGAEAELKQFLGSLVCFFEKEGTVIQKTTLYFLAKLVSVEDAKRKDGDPERCSEIRWVKPEEVIPRMKAQGVRFGRADVDESSILERLVG